jgi:N-acetylmuramoyl-L-alanine amidase
MYFAVVAALLTVALSICVLSSAFLLNEDVVDAIAPAFSGAQGRIVVIDAGHGGEDCGAIGINGKYEKDLNLEMSRILGGYLQKAGYAVVYTRTEDKMLYTEDQNIKGFRKIYDLKNRVAMANDFPDAIFVSLHMNSFAEEKYSGLQVYYSVGNEESYSLASAVQNRVISDVQPNNNRRVKEGKNIYLMEKLRCTSVLIECGFLTNPEESRLLCEKEYQKILSFSIVCGIIEYIERK